MTPSTVAPRSMDARMLQLRAATPARLPVRVCFLIDDLAPAGTEMQLLALLRHLDRRRVQPYLCLLHGDSPVSQALEPDDCPILRLGVGSLHHLATLWRFGRFVRFLRRERIDVVQTYFPDSSYFGVPAAWLAGVPHRVRTRNNLGHWMTPFHRCLGRALNALTTCAIANCEAARRALLEVEKPAAESVFVLENGVDLERFRDMPPLAECSPREPRVGVVSNLRPVKGLDLFVSAAARLRDRHRRAIFAVAGEGELRASLEEQARRAGLAGQFQILGSVTDVPEFLAGLDVAVLCSHAEGMSNALLEYMAAGRAIVATAVGAATELIEDGTHGLLVSPGDAERLAEAVGRLLDDRQLARRLGKAARRRALERYNREAMIRRFEDFYELLVAGRGGANA